MPPWNSPYHPLNHPPCHTPAHARDASASRHQRDVHIGVAGLADALVDAVGRAIHVAAQEAPHSLGRDHTRCLLSVCVVGLVGIRITAAVVVWNHVLLEELAVAQKHATLLDGLGHTVYT